MSKGAYEETKKYLKENKDITAIFAISDIMAIGVAKAIFDLGLKIGKDISIVGFDGMDESEFYNPGITTVKQPKKEIAQKSIELLFDLLKGEMKINILLLETKLIERESCQYNKISSLSYIDYYVLKGGVMHEKKCRSYNAYIFFTR